MQLASLDLALLRRHKPPCHTAVVEEASGSMCAQPSPGYAGSPFAPRLKRLVWLPLLLSCSCRLLCLFSGSWGVRRRVGLYPCIANLPGDSLCYLGNWAPLCELILLPSISVQPWFLLFWTSNFVGVHCHLCSYGDPPSTITHHRSLPSLFSSLSLSCCLFLPLSFPLHLWFPCLFHVPQVRRR